MAKQIRVRTPKPLKLKDAKKLDRIESLLNQGQDEEAERELLEFTHMNPDIVEGWELLLEFASIFRNQHLAWKAARQLVLLEPGEELHRYNFAVSSAALGSPFSTLKHVRYYLEHFPNGIYRRQIGEIEAVTAPVCETLLREDEMAKLAADPDDLALFEEAQVLVSSGEYVEGRKLSQEVAKRLPGAPAPLNNISLAYAVEGNLAEALKVSQQVLELHPQNLHARCNLVQVFVRLGREAEIQSVLEGLRQTTPEDPSHWGKLIETFAVAGDDAGVIDVYRRAQKHLGRKADAALLPLFHHLAAVSYACLDNEREARQLWKKALAQSPSLQVAQDNLDDIQLPIGERNGAWHFPIQQWLPAQWVRQLERLTSSSLKGRQNKLRNAIERAFQINPALETALSILLKRGDPIGREVALHVTAHYPLPGLREFALGRHGSDEDRMEAARYASEYGLIDTSQPVPLYIRGKQTELLLLNYEIYGEPVESDLPEQAQEYLEAAHEALQEKQPEEAFEWIELGLKIVPDEKTFLNYKAVAFSMQNRHNEAKAVIEHMAALYPDYLFARCGMAQYCVREKRLDEAEAWLKPLLTQTRFHHSEFKALALAQADLLKARGQKDGANAWLQMWQQYELEQLAMEFDDDEFDDEA
jgi:predicted Zn-dependent protease